jgi:arylsulfatase A-like enzyme
VRVSDATLVDIAPTVLYAMKEPVPQDMDGRVVREIFEESFLREHEVRIVDANDGASGRTGDGYTDREEEIIAARLKGLGYLD